MASEVETLTARGARRDGRGARRASGAGGCPSSSAPATPTRRGARHGRAKGIAAGAVAAMMMAPTGAGQDVAKQSRSIAAVAEARPACRSCCRTRRRRRARACRPSGRRDLPRRARHPLRQGGDAALRPACRAHPGRGGRALDGVFGGAGARYVMDELARGAAGTMPALELADVHARAVGAWQAGRPRGRAAPLHATLPLLCVPDGVPRARHQGGAAAARPAGPHRTRAPPGPVLDARDIAEIARAARHRRRRCCRSRLGP